MPEDPSVPSDDPTSDPVPADPRAAPALVSWHLVGSSRELLDTTFCNGNFPSPWQTSLAVFAAAAPATSCERIVWLKVAVTLTGIQVDEHAQALFDHLPPESAALDTLDQYLGCYGAMLRVGVYARHRLPGTARRTGLMIRRGVRELSTASRETATSIKLQRSKVKC